MSETETDKTAAAPAPHRVRRVILWTAGLVIVPACLILIAGLALMWYARGQTFDAPDWVKTRVETRIASGLSNISIRFEGITLAVAENWQPSVHLTNVDIQPKGRATPITLSDVTGSFDLAALLDGELRPRTISVTGTQLFVSRAQDGSYGVVLGTPSGLAAQEVGDALIGLSEILDHPTLSALRRIEGAALSVRYEDHLSARAWTVDGGRLALTRDGKDLRLRGDFAVLGGHAYATTGDVTIDAEMYSRAATLSISVQDAAALDLATQSPGLAWLGVLDAPISGALRVSTSDTGEIGPLFGTLQIGAGQLAPGGTENPVPFTSARSYFQYDPATATIVFNELSVASDWVNTTAEGRVVLSGISGADPATMIGQLRFTNTVMNPAGIYASPVILDGADAEMRLALNPFRLDLGRLDLRNKGQTLALRGWVAAEPDGWDMSVTAQMAELGADDLLGLWPPKAALKTREWVSRNVLDGTLRNLQLGLRSTPDSPPDVMVGFDFDDLITTFMPTMPPIEAATGHAELRGNRFTVTAEDGRIQAADGDGISIAGTSFIYEDVTVKRGPAQVLARADGALPDILSLIDRKPFSLLSKAGRTPDIATGQARVSADLRFNLIKNLPPDAIDVAYSAELSDVRSEQIVPGQTLTAETLRIDGTTDQITVTGEAQLGQIPVGGQWQATLGPEGQGKSQLEGWLTVSQTAADQLNLGLPPGTIDGAGRANIRLDFARDTDPVFTLTSDLQGIGLRIDALNWTLAQGQTGQFEIAGQLGTPPQIDRVRLEAPGLSGAGTVSLSADGGLEVARFDRVRLGSWLDAPVVLTGRGKGVAPRVSINSGTVDLRGAELGKPSGKGGPISLALDRLQLSDTMFISGMRADFDTAGGMRGGFTGALNGQAAIRGTVAPQNNGSAIHIVSDNAGAALAAGGLLEKGRGGGLDLKLVPVGPKGTYDGTLMINDIWLQDAPAMASLLSALSVVGLLEQMSGNGILFNTAEADFRLSPSRVVVRSASAVGASMGLSIDGIYDLDRKTMDMQGVVSPLYVVNGLGRIFSRNKGEGLIGFNYSLSGPASDPKVQVNPLSLFTPGLFREIFRRPPPTTN